MPHSEPANSNPPPRDPLSEMLRGYVEVAKRLEHTHETLQLEVVRLRNELASKNLELERRRRLAALGEIAAGVAHEVRNPLGAISLYNGLLRSRCENSAQALELIEKIEAGIKAIDGIVQDTLALVPRGGTLLPCRLKTILDGAHEFCLETLQSRRVSFQSEFEDPDVEVSAHENALKRVFVNLIVNAAEASPAGAAVAVSVSSTTGGWVETRVLDDGPGLPADKEDRIFDPFFTTKPNGTGLGLSIAHRLVDIHGGKLTARNRAHHGAEFIVALPLETTGKLGPSNQDSRHTTAA